MSKLYIPGGQAVTPEQPKTSAIVMQTANGETVAFPQVAVAVITPDVINLIAEALYQRIEHGAIMQPDGQFGIEELPPLEDPPKKTFINADGIR